jgi:two-component system sensor histidine kinase ChiS
MDMTVMFSDIRDFTTISERIGPTETIALLNDYLSRMGPLIRAQNGFIDKYIGDAIMALFPERVEDAVAAILDMMDALDVFRIEMAKQGKDVTDSGFAIHTGSLMLGIIGEAERYEGTVIADTVNLAARLESLTKYYGVRALLSGVSVRRLASRRQPLRFLDAVQVKGKTQAVLLYELVGRGDPLRDVKLGQAATYKAAYRHYAKAEFEQAVTVFERYLAATPGDRPAQILLERSQRYLTSGAPDNWQGITIFHDK